MGRRAGVDGDEPRGRLEEHALGRAIGVAPDTPPGGSSVAAVTPPVRERRVAAHSAWWSCAHRAIRRPGRHALEVVGRRPAAPAVRVPAVALEPGVRVRRARRDGRRRSRRRPSSSVATRREVELAGRERRLRRDAGARRSARGSPPRRARGRSVRVNGSARVSRSTSDPANATRPSRMPMASTQPKPARPPSVAIRPVISASSGTRRSVPVGGVGGAGVLDRRRLPSAGGRRGGAAVAGAAVAARGGVVAVRRRLVPGRPVRSERRRDRVDGVRIGLGVGLEQRPAHREGRDAGDERRDRDDEDDRRRPDRGPRSCRR